MMSQEFDPKALAARFRNCFGTDPRVFRAPGRINLIGEHTDYCGGFVMPAAIDRYCAIAAAPNGSRSLRIVAADLDSKITLDLGSLSPTGTWSDYCAGIAWVLGKAGIVLEGVDLWIESNLPMGAGVSSSAALEVATALALLSSAGEQAEGLQIAQWAQAAENEFVGMPCGIMDQFASANGSAGKALLLDCRSLDCRTLPIPKQAAILLVNSMIRHAHTEGDYKQRRADCEMAARALGIDQLRDISVADLPDAFNKLSDGQKKRCRHVVTENARVMEMAAALEAGELLVVGNILDASHQSLRDDMQVSVEHVDRLAAIAQDTPGVYGARMVGGGFGGCVLALVEADEIETVATSIAEIYGGYLGKKPDTLVCRAVDGAGEVIL